MHLGGVMSTEWEYIRSVFAVTDRLRWWRTPISWHDEIGKNRSHFAAFSMVWYVLRMYVSCIDDKGSDRSLMKYLTSHVSISTSPFLHDKFTKRFLHTTGEITSYNVRSPSLSHLAFEHWYWWMYTVDEQSSISILTHVWNMYPHNSLTQQETVCLDSALPALYSTASY